MRTITSIMIAYIWLTNVKKRDVNNSVSSQTCFSDTNFTVSIRKPNVDKESKVSY